ncbi:putative 2-oxoglutarate dehydrogenase E1 component DHKTD1, mitochondrial [Psilocybe cubensis]|uniref:2-oxoglutarate dehydrogenase E1 component DHKTD1, mitochondrial n=1 Tax=Psilocybe cubensis TaxID=181762 RepID=A0ACB8GRL4_PSICU|nr:putative 2-oxoglutarate dehydrogenase E1 component DHKTD1, mitochondrial [Psilocybe cubensis]KAH9478201.1 putative 2-oxoglutarate dehydrogenase E1 component DHKTD1, mitochondrial [Psilocybe cubensis]
MKSGLALPRRVLSVRSPKQRLGSAACRAYHDESFGFRKPREYDFPDYTEVQLNNRAKNSPLLRYVDSMRTHSHRAARIDPLDLIHREEVAALFPERYGLNDDDKVYDVNGIIWTKRVGEAGEGEELWNLKQIREHLRKVYVGNIAYEFMHSPSKTERLWFSHLLESQSLPSPEDTPLVQMDITKKKRIHELLARSEVFDNFLQLKFPNLKRYGLEGGESMLPALDSLFSAASLAGVHHVILAMPHRGRLNLLTDILQYSPAALFHKIKGGYEIPEDLGAEGDVLSHLVSSPSLSYPGASHPIKVSLLPNPSHLEAVNSVAMGKTRAKQYSLLKTSPDDCKLGDKVMCVQLHGDASFTGQGVVMESLGLSNLPHFTSGGSVHLVVDIGYTTPASNARSSLYCSDIGKMINAPVLHVNGDHPEDVAKAMDIAFRYRNYFRKDIIVDLLVYRRCITSPLMYEKIAARKSVPQLYEQKLVAEEVLTLEDINAVRTSYKSQLEAELARVPTYVPSASMLEEQWSGIVWPATPEAQHNPVTGVERDVLEKIGKASVAVPEGFQIHPKLHRHVKNRLQSVTTGKGIDFATAEALAFGSLLLEGNDVRISGQDVGRGTFSHRHAMLVNQQNEGVIVPLNDELKADGKLELANSSLSEMAVLGFEYGASWERPNLLPIWEAQFGDFFNGAQIIIDTFISSSETKWLKQSAMVLMLPHGLDGAGPEHSSSRLERMLQLTNDRYDYNSEPNNINMHVTFPTTPAQYFHLLRRQICRNYRKPLVIAGPKGLLRLSAAASTMEDMESGTQFKPVIADPVAHPVKVKKLVMLSGKIYYDLIKERQARGLDDSVAFIRIEELAPFPFEQLEEVLEQYPNVETYSWLQEEPRNQGAFAHVSGRIASVLRKMGKGNEELVYLGRKESALPAPGVGKLYQVQQRQVLESPFVGL